MHTKKTNIPRSVKSDANKRLAINQRRWGVKAIEIAPGMALSEFRDISVIQES